MAEPAKIQPIVKPEGRRITDVRTHHAIQAGAFNSQTISTVKHQAEITEGTHGLWVKLPQKDAPPRLVCIPYTNIAYWSVE